MILLYSCELSMHPLKDLNFKIFVFMLKFKTYKIRNAIHSPVYLSSTSTGTVRDFSHRNVNISHRTVNPPTEYKQFIIRQFLHGEYYRTVKICNHTVRIFAPIPLR
jgi:hypothetical protein